MNSENLEQISRKRRSNFLAELVGFLKENKKWWMIPIILAFALLGVLAIFATTGAAPFIYTLF